MKITHGLSKRNAVHPLYWVWRSMISRCHNPNDTIYRNYGAIGIKVCDEWRNDIKVFYNWAIGNGYKKGLELDKDKLASTKPGKLYSPKYCSFITHAENNQNKKTTKLNWNSINEIRNIKLLIPTIKLKELGEAYNISSSYVSAILKNKKWVL